MKKILYLILTILLLAGSTTAMFFADRIQKDEGNVELIDGTINLPEGITPYF